MQTDRGCKARDRDRASDRANERIKERSNCDTTRVRITCRAREQKMTEEIPTVKGAHVTTLHKGTHLSAFWYKGAHLTTHISVYLPTYLSSFSLEYITITMFMEDSKRLHTKRCYTSGNKKHTKKAHKHAQKAFTGPPSKDSYSYWSCSNGDLNPPFRPPSAQSNSG